MKRIAQWVVLSVVAVIAASVVASDAQKKADSDSKKDKPATVKLTKEEDAWMHAKLQSSQDIFAGLTRGDLDLVQKRARGMLLTGILENWLRKSDFTKKSAYQGQLNAFEFANKELIRHAEDGDIDGTLDAWVKLSRSCVECHKVIRDTGKH